MRKFQSKSSKAAAPDLSEPVAHNQKLGRSGEAKAARWYEANGFQVIERNWRCREGEIDLVVQGNGVTAFSEVKSRSGSTFGHPAEAVTWRKQLRIRRLAAIYLGSHDVSGDVRFDVVSVEGDRIEVVESAF